MIDDVPLIATKKGNLPELELKYETTWIHVLGDYIQFIERHLDDTGEVVRESAHVYKFEGLAGAALPSES